MRDTDMQHVRQEMYAEPADIRQGVFYVPDTPGASTTFDEAKFKAFRIA